MEGKSTVSGTVRIPLHSRKFPGLFATIDAADLPLVEGYRWSVLKDGETFYAVSIEVIRGRPNRATRSTRMHRLLLGLGDDRSIWGDHEDGDGLNNTRRNLRRCNPAQNARNRRKSTRTASPYKGVTLLHRTGRWRATIRIDDRNHHLGYFATPEEAARAYDLAARDAYGAFASLNFPDDGSHQNEK